ncbi:MAG: DNA polymerase III subunit gamma/tau [Actinomycetota bacterium]|nr:DNA polymerase III subunit gamma/tau [Actinomycetota bacterium]
MPEAPSLYRRHRPRNFADVVGQEPVVRTLRNAVEQDKVHHAYLFVGSRGTGKTSMAKILAACLNCERGPTTEPCGSCDSCTSIASATSLDVIEMDAASNNSVDDIRDLRERVGYAPVSGRHKIYILDEAHMLSTQAWNAFLKTLEEPPPNTVFVLATTEAQKVLPTVVDRCHRFDFTRPSAQEIATVLRRVAQAEGIELPDTACALLARSATGSFRDALGTLEQLVTYAGGRIEVDSVLAVLGVADAELLFAAVDAVANGDARAALLAAARLDDSSRDAGQFLRDLEAHTRELLVIQAIGEVPPELRITPDRDERLLEQAGRAGRADVVRILDLLADAFEALKAGSEPRVQLELALVKAAAPELDASTRALQARIERLEAQLAGRGAAPVVRAVGEPLPEAPRRAERETSEAEPESAVGSGSGTVAAVVAVAAVEPHPEAEVQVAEPQPGRNPAEGELDLDGLRSVWPAILEAVRDQNAMLAALLDGATPIALTAAVSGGPGGELTIAFAESAAFLKRKAEVGVNRDALARAIQTVSGRMFRLAYELRADSSDGDGPAPPTPPLSEEALLARFMAEFDAEELSDEQEEEPS